MRKAWQNRLPLLPSQRQERCIDHLHRAEDAGLLARQGPCVSDAGTACFTLWELVVIIVNAPWGTVTTPTWRLDEHHEPGCPYAVKLKWPKP